MKKFAVFILFFSTVLTAEAQADKTIGSDKACNRHAQYNILDFGAIGDGVTICTDAINSAIERCSANGGGTVVVPAGVFKSGTVGMKNDVELHLATGSTLLAATDRDYFPPQAGGRIALIHANGVSNIAITGFGTIDGNGELQKTITGKPNAGFRQHSILFVACRQVRIEGVRMVNTGTWVQHYFDCEDVIIDRIEVYTHANNNNDALDLNGCRRVTLSNSIFDTDDDAITLKSTTKTPTEDITVTNCIVSSKSNAIKAGTESLGGFRNITISNCVIRPSRQREQPPWNTALPGITGITLAIVDGGVMEGVAISNITIEETLCPLYIRLGNRGRKTSETAPDPPVGKLRNVTISNVVAYNSGNFSNSITGIPGHCVENITIDNVQFFNQGGMTVRDGWLSGGDNALVDLGGLTGGKYTADYKKVEEHEKGYPDAREWGYLPSSVFFIRHVKGLSINNLMFGSKENDQRVPVIAVDVERFRLGKSIFSGDFFPPCFAIFDDVKAFDVEKPLGWGANTFLVPVGQTEK